MQLRDRGAGPARDEPCPRLKDALPDWSLRDHSRIAMPDAHIAAGNEATQLRAGIAIGFWDQMELDAAEPR